jgi:ribulose-phosphate 3-epimerase
MESDLKVVAAKMLSLKEKKIDRVHIDIGDGLFSDLLTIAPSDLQEIDIANMRMDIHLLVDDPSEWIEECVALNPKRVIGQIERMGSQEVFVDTVLGYKCRAGIALKIDTDIEEIDPLAMKKVSTILLLAIPPGTTGSPLDMKIFQKIKDLRKIYDGSILIDGAMDTDTYAKVLDAGATEAGSNSAWWRGDYD